MWIESLQKKEKMQDVKVSAADFDSESVTVYLSFILFLLFVFLLLVIPSI